MSVRATSMVIPSSGEPGVRPLVAVMPFSSGRTSLYPTRVPTPTEYDDCPPEPEDARQDWASVDELERALHAAVVREHWRQQPPGQYAADVYLRRTVCTAQQCPPSEIGPAEPVFCRGCLFRFLCAASRPSSECPGVARAEPDSC